MAVLLKELITMAVTIVIAIALFTATTTTVAKTSPSPAEAPKNIKGSRFLMHYKAGGWKPRNPNAADHCHNNPEVCNNYDAGGNLTTAACCNNKCVDLDCDKHNCGACGNKCKFTQSCCCGECVYLAFNNSHCGQCNKRCSLDGVCVYGLCNYA